MKVITDTTVFENSRLNLDYAYKSTKYFSMGKFNSNEVIILPPKPDWSMLWGTSIFVEEWGAGVHLRRENPTFFSIEYIVEGSLYFRQDNRSYLAHSDDICLLHPNRTNEIMTGPDKKCKKKSFLIIGEILEHFLESTGLNKLDVLGSADTGRFDLIIERIKNIYQDFGDDSKLHLSCMTYEILQLLAKGKSNLRLPASLTRLLQYMNLNFNKHLTLKDLAEKCGCSQSRIAQQFQLYFKTSPYKMLTQIRMQQAARYLLETDRACKEISSLCGYSNALNFSTEFKKYFGISPRNYRRQGQFSVWEQQKLNS